MRLYLTVGISIGRSSLLRLCCGSFGTSGRRVFLHREFARETDQPGQADLRCVDSLGQRRWRPSCCCACHHITGKERYFPARRKCCARTMTPWKASRSASPTCLCAVGFLYCRSQRDRDRRRMRPKRRVEELIDGRSIRSINRTRVSNSPLRMNRWRKFRRCSKGKPKSTANPTVYVCQKFHLLGAGDECQ